MAQTIRQFRPDHTGYIGTFTIKQVTISRVIKGCRRAFSSSTTSTSPSCNVSK